MQKVEVTAVRDGCSVVVLIDNGRVQTERIKSLLESGLKYESALGDIETMDINAARGSIAGRKRIMKLTDSTTFDEAIYRVKYGWKCTKALEHIEKNGLHVNKTINEWLVWSPEKPALRTTGIGDTISKAVADYKAKNEKPVPRYVVRNFSEFTGPQTTYEVVENSTLKSRCSFKFKEDAETFAALLNQEAESSNPETSGE